MSDPADSKPNPVVVLSYAMRGQMRRGRLRSWLLGWISRYGPLTWTMLGLAVAMAGWFWQVSGVWRPTVIASAPGGFHFSPGPAGAFDATMSPDERLLAFSTGKGVAIFDRGAGRAVTNIPYPTGITGLTFSRDGHILAIQDLHFALCIFDSATGKKRFDLARGAVASPDQGPDTIRFSPDGSRLAIKDPHGHGYLWDWENHILLASSIYGLEQPTFTPDGRYFLDVEIPTEVIHIRCRDASNGKLASSVDLSWNGGPDDDPSAVEPSSVKISPDGSCVEYENHCTGSSDLLHFIDSRTGAERVAPVTVTDGQTSNIFLHFAPNSMLFSTCTFKSESSSSIDSMGIVSIDLSTGKAAALPRPRLYPTRVFMSPDGRFLVRVGTSSTDTLVLNARTLKTVLDLPPYSAQLQPPFSSDGRRFVGESSIGYQIYDTATWKLISTIPLHGNLVASLGDGSILEAHGDSLISWRQRRPDAWYGIAVLWQFWVAVAATAAFCVSALRDRHKRRAQPHPTAHA